MIAQAAPPRDIGVWEWLFDGDSWTGQAGVLEALRETATMCAGVLLTAVLLAVPAAAILSHRGRGRFVATWAVTLSRAVPTFAIAGLLVPFSLRRGWGSEPWPIFVGLLLLALPPIFLNTYTAVHEAEQAVIDAARAMGLTESSILLRVEMAMGAGVVMAGIRVAAVQVVATEPIRAFLGGDGLGRYVRDGLGQNNDGLLVAGALLIAAFAAATGLAFGALERTLPAGLRRRPASQPSQRAPRRRDHP